MHNGYKELLPGSIPCSHGIDSFSICFKEAEISGMIFLARGWIYSSPTLRQFGLPDSASL